MKMENVLLMLNDVPQSKKGMLFIMQKYLQALLYNFPYHSIELLMRRKIIIINKNS
jgi:hypothetical protein